MIDHHYVTTIQRYVDALMSKTALIAHTGATRQLMLEVATISKTVSNLANASLDDAQGESDE
jgi:hypothetical protein